MTNDCSTGFSTRFCSDFTLSQPMQATPMKTMAVGWSTQSPVVLALQQFLTALDVPVNRTVVREAVVASPQFPVISLKDIVKILRGWQFETTLFKTKPHLLNQLKGPLLAYCTWFDGDTYFVVIRRVDNELVHYFSPFAGEVVEPLTEFAVHWQGLLLSVSFSEHCTSPFRKKFDEETAAVQSYEREAIDVNDNFITAEHCQYIIRYAEEQTHFGRSKVDGMQLSSGRTSSSITLHDREDPVLQVLYQRVANWLGVLQENIETLQCVRYSEGQQFKPHYDVNAHNRPLHTLLLYLNDDFDGGETFFPELNVKIKPAQGRVLHFLNCDEADQVLLQAIHAGLPVQRGVKYACNIWVHKNQLS